MYQFPDDAHPAKSLACLYHRLMVNTIESSHEIGLRFAAQVQK